MKKWVREQKEIQRKFKKGNISHGKKTNKHTGSSFSYFLETEELEAEISARAAKKNFISKLEKNVGNKGK